MAGENDGTGDLDYTTLGADFASEFAGSHSDGGGGDDPLDGGAGSGARQEPVTPPSGTPPQTPTPSPDFQQLTMPKSWKSEHTPLWEKITDHATRKYIHDREGEVSRGIQMYHEGYQNWSSVMEPFKPVLQNHPQFDSKQQVQLMQNLMHSHLRLLGLKGPEKATFIKTLLSAYGVDPAELAGGAPNPQTPAPAAVIPPELVQKITSHDQLLQQMTDERTRASVDSFFADPKNEFAAELAPDILQLLKEGSARDLPTAYKLALWQNEAVRKKLIDKEVEARTRAEADAAAKNARLQKGNRGSSEDGTPPKGKKLTVDDTVAGVLEKYSTH